MVHPQQSHSRPPQRVVVVSGDQSQPSAVEQPETFMGQMILACLVMWTCNWLFGLIAFILAAMASDVAVSDPERSRKLGTQSWECSAFGIVIGVIIIIIVVAVVASEPEDESASSSDTSNTGSSYEYEKEYVYDPCNGGYYVGGSCYRYRDYWDYYASYYYYCDGYYEDNYCYYN